MEGYTPHCQVLVEEYAIGQMFKIDGYMWDAKFFPCAIGFKFSSENDSFDQGFSEMGGLYFAPQSPALLGRELNIICEWAAALLNALAFKSGTFHIEGVLRDGEPDLIEVNPRPGGSEITRIVKQLSGVDLREEMVRLWLGMRPATLPKPQNLTSLAYAVLYPAYKGRITSVTPPGIVKLCVDSFSNQSASWRPSPDLSLGKIVGHHRGEEYLGELHIENPELRHDRSRAISALIEFAEKPLLLEISPDDEI